MPTIFLFSSLGWRLRSFENDDCFLFEHLRSTENDEYFKFGHLRSSEHDEGFIVLNLPLFGNRPSGSRRPHRDSDAGKDKITSSSVAPGSRRPDRYSFPGRQSSSLNLHRAKAVFSCFRCSWGAVATALGLGFQIGLY